MSWIARLCSIVKCHGNLKKSFLTLLRTDDLKFGQFVGKDEMGNCYYENDYYFFVRNRWMIYSNKFGYDYDASQIHPEWFRWLHYITDLKPYEEERVVHEWMLPYEENGTGTEREYVPYSTTKPRIVAWKPPRQQCKSR
ncbi:hypothetical protein RUM44_006191 [Polyplax serrata]|uniref:NADH dehydrogenase [ubiquinone] 1 alpha subcomplex subunit 12 n=1 Tax=Polyplax serrata TaxID=468196 RepID=A0ABR1AHK7_POLSC